MNVCKSCGESHGFHLPWCGIKSELRKQPTPWSCLPTAFALVLDVEVDAILTDVGHNDARGFHVMELTWWALKRNRVFVPYDAEIRLEDRACSDCRHGQVSVYVPHEYGERQAECPKCSGTGIEDGQSFLNVPKMEDLLFNYDGVLTGHAKKGSHAVAWKDKRVLDPNYSTYAVADFDIDTFWALVR